MKETRGVSSSRVHSRWRIFTAAIDIWRDNGQGQQEDDLTFCAGTCVARRVSLLLLDARCSLRVSLSGTSREWRRKAFAWTKAAGYYNTYTHVSLRVCMHACMHLPKEAAAVLYESAGAERIRAEMGYCARSDSLNNWLNECAQLNLDAPWNYNREETDWFCSSPAFKSDH